MALVWERVQTDDRQHHMMADDRGVLGGQQVPPTVAKNARTWLASTPWGVGDVDDRVSAVQGGGQARSGG